MQYTHDDYAEAMNLLHRLGQTGSSWAWSLHQLLYHDERPIQLKLEDFYREVNEVIDFGRELGILPANKD